MIEILQGDWTEVLRSLPEKSVHCCVTSPPYWGLRDYCVEGQLGLEPTLEEYVAKMVDGFREVRRVLRDDGTLWLNLGDSYSHSKPKQKQGDWTNTQGRLNWSNNQSHSVAGLLPKNLVGIPWRVAFALQADGWYLRSDIIWHKPNPMPESVTDRPTKAHEYIFLLSKSERYYYDQDAILEQCSLNTHARLSQDVQNQIGSARANGGTRSDRPMKAVGRKFDSGSGNKNNPNFDAALAIMPEKRNKRTVWTVATKSYSGAHFATYPPELIEPCILAGCPEGGTVLDPFVGSGTTLEIAETLYRNSIGIELNPDYIRLANKRVKYLKSQVKLFEAMR